MPAASMAPGAHGNDTHISINKRSAQDVVAQLGLIANVEKGYFLQTFQDEDSNANNRSASTAIYYLLEGSSGPSYWHHVDAVEIWHYYAGAPLTLSLSKNDGQPVTEKVLGPDVFDGQQPQVVIAKGEWQRAQSLGDWTLVGTTGNILPNIPPFPCNKQLTSKSVAPGFVESGFVLAAPDWEPNGA